MPPVVRKDGVDLVDSPDGDPGDCEDPSIQVTDAGSGDVFANNIGVVRAGDAMIAHETDDYGACQEHAPTCSTYSPNVYANFLNVMRLGDAYRTGGAGPDSPGLAAYEFHPTITGSPNVFAN